LPLLAQGFSQAASASATVPEVVSGKAQCAAALGGVLAGIFGASCVASANEVSDGLHAVSYPWPHEGIFDSYDHASIRRGHQVYTQVLRLDQRNWKANQLSTQQSSTPLIPQVCAACHSMQYLHWRQMVGVAYTEEEAKALAFETEVRSARLKAPNMKKETLELHLAIYLSILFSS
jgi:ubiquinol-cytochrome c reductase cytochrome c1 subunit